MPAGIRLTGRAVLVVGGGAVALRKIRLLSRSGARITLISPDALPAIRNFAAAGKIVWRRKRWDGRGVGPNPVMVFACTDDPAVNRKVAAWAKKSGAWINRADDPAGSNIHIPAIAKTGPILIALFSGGAAPAYVKYLRQRIWRALGPDISSELRLIAQIRRALKSRVPGAAERKRRLTALLKTGRIRVLAKKSPAARRAAVRQLLKER